MTPVELSDPIYHDEDAARAHLESLRWPEGPVCFHCGSVEQIRPLNGKSMGPGWYYCGACKDKFTVRMGAVYERSHIPLHKWLLAFRLMASSKKGMSAHQLHRTLNITYKSAWFLAHRIREAMDESASGPLGGGGKTIEADEVYTVGGDYVFVNGKGWVKKAHSPGGRVRVLTIVERGGRARSIKMDNLRAETVRKAILDNASTESVLHTDEARFYKRIGKEFAGHASVNHSIEEYVRDGVTTNTVEGFFGIFRRGMKGTYQHCSEKHLQRYFHEFDFRYSNRIALGCDDSERTTRAIKGASGKRLTYRQPAIGAHV